VATGSIPNLAATVLLDLSVECEANDRRSDEVENFIYTGGLLTDIKCKEVVEHIADFLCNALMFRPAIGKLNMFPYRNDRSDPCFLD
jgi:hypothetical protein